MYRRCLQVLGALTVLAIMAGCASPPKKYASSHLFTDPLNNMHSATHPKFAMSNGIEGKVVVEGDLDDDGNLTEVRIVSASPKVLFDDAVMAAFRKWQFGDKAHRLAANEKDIARATFKLNLGDGMKKFADYQQESRDKAKEQGKQDPKNFSLRIPQIDEEEAQPVSPEEAERGVTSRGVVLAQAALMLSNEWCKPDGNDAVWLLGYFKDPQFDDWMPDQPGYLGCSIAMNYYYYQCAVDTGFPARINIRDKEQFGPPMSALTECVKGRAEQLSRQIVASILGPVSR